MFTHKSARFFFYRWVISNLALKFSFVTNRFDSQFDLDSVTCVVRVNSWIVSAQKTRSTKPHETKPGNEGDETEPKHSRIELEKLASEY